VRTSEQSVSPLPPGTAFGRYQIVRLLGVGGMGMVYEGLHAELRKRVAIKVLQPEFAQSADARTRFLREGEAAARIRHPHVVDVSDVGTHDGLPFLVMEYLEGEDLGALLFREGALSIERSLDILLPILAGVAAGHAQGVIHRDLKPQNIFISVGWDGEIVPKALDFGVSKLLDAGGASVNVTQAGAVYGTVQYMSPEQARGASDVGAASDQYALAEILYECLTGKLAYPGDNTLEVLRRVASNDFVPPRQLLSALPEPLEAIILRAMKLEPGARFESLGALGGALLRFASLRARVLWGGAFGASVAPVGERAKVEPSAARTLAGPGPLFQPGGSATQLLEPEAKGPGSSTLLLADQHPTPAARRARWVLLVGALGTGLVVLWLLVPRSRAVVRPPEPETIVTPATREPEAIVAPATREPAANVAPAREPAANVAPARPVRIGAPGSAGPAASAPSVAPHAPASPVPAAKPARVPAVPAPAAAVHTRPVPDPSHPRRVRRAAHRSPIVD
jgi:tRNA A-37 threonylcarbamoyl transferase component Bud32